MAWFRYQKDDRALSALTATVEELRADVEELKVNFDKLLEAYRAADLVVPHSALKQLKEDMDKAFTLPEFPEG